MPPTRRSYQATPVVHLIGVPVSSWPDGVMVIFADQTVLIDCCTGGRQRWLPARYRFMNAPYFGRSSDEITKRIEQGEVLHVRRDEHAHPFVNPVAPEHRTPPAGGWSDGDWIVTNGGFALKRDSAHDPAEPWQSSDPFDPGFALRYSDAEVTTSIVRHGVFVVAPRPTDRPPLPTHPGAAIVGTVVVGDRQGEATLVLSADGSWVVINPLHGKTHFTDSEVVAFEPLLTRAQWTAAD